MIATEKMVNTIPPKDGWKDILKDKRWKTVNAVPRFMDILMNFDPSILPKEYLREFRRRSPYDHDDLNTHRDESLAALPESYFRLIHEMYRAEELKDDLGRSYIRLLLATDAYREGRIGDNGFRRAYARTRAKLIAAIGAKASAYIASTEE